MENKIINFIKRFSLWIEIDVWKNCFAFTFDFICVWGYEGLIIDFIFNFLVFHFDIRFGYRNESEK